MGTPEMFGICIECHGTQCVHHRTIKMHICMRRKQLDWCTHCGQEIPKQVYALSWCKPVTWEIVHQADENKSRMVGKGYQQ